MSPNHHKKTLPPGAPHGTLPKKKVGSLGSLGLIELIELIESTRSTHSIGSLMVNRVALACLLAAASSALAQQTPIRITADLTDAPRKLFHAEIDIPVHPGPTAITAAPRIPGHHATKHTDNDITGLVFTAAGQTIPWRRDDVDLYQFHLTIPAGVTTLHAHLDYIVNIKATNDLAVLEWEDLMLYPANTPVRQIAIEPSVIVPDGWAVATSLTPNSPTPEHPAGGKVSYAATTVQTLEDSPIFTGIHFHQYPLATTPKPVFLDVFGDNAEDVELRPNVLADLEKLVPEAVAMYSSTHYDSYRFLLTLTKHGPYGGLEHHESSDNSLPNASFTTDDLTAVAGPVLAHEYTHSWNGKYRRPAGLATPDFATPMKGELLWVYEGLTDYLGYVLGTRCGFMTPDQYHDYIAATAARLDYTSGRQWRSTDDTAVGISGLQGGAAWANWRRSSDYYTEGDLLWLDVDTTLRKLTADKKSLRDFLTIFVAGHGSTPPEIVPYDLDELVRDLNQVVPNDWSAFLRERVYQVQPHANLEGIEQGGWKLVYTDKPTPYSKIALRPGTPALNVWYSLGLAVGADGAITDVRVGGPADKAKLAPGEKILAVDGHLFTNASLLNALRTAKTTTTPIPFIIQSDTLVLNIPIDYHEGERYPTLVRVEGTPDYLDEILKPLTPAK
jgi:predicted metalloprotease with PDZ domain